LAIEYFISSFGYGSTYDACAGLDATIQVYAPPGYTTPMVGMIFYDNSNLTVPHNGGSSGQWFLLVKGGTTWAAQVNTSGVVLDYVLCSTLPSQTPTNTSTPTRTPTPTTEAPTSFTISWTNNSVTTGTNILTIYKNSTLIVNQSGLGSNSFSVISTDVITYELTSTTPDYTEVQIIDSVHGTISSCGFNSANVAETTGVSYTANATIDGVTTNYTDGCP
jgi:hypothetical protein